MDRDPDLKLIQAALDMLIEHFDSVHIFATRHSPSEGGTIQVNRGHGNWYARCGQVQEWLVKNAEEVRVEVRPDNPDDGWKR